MSPDQEHNESVDAATRGLDGLIQASTELEQTLEEAGVARAHELMFAVREILYDLRRLTVSLAQALAAESPEDVSEGLDHFATMFRYEVMPHVQGHLEDLRRASDPEQEEESQ